MDEKFRSDVMIGEYERYFADEYERFKRSILVVAGGIFIVGFTVGFFIGYLI